MGDAPDVDPPFPRRGDCTRGGWRGRGWGGERGDGRGAREGGWRAAAEGRKHAQGDRPKNAKDGQALGLTLGSGAADMPAGTGAAPPGAAHTTEAAGPPPAGSRFEAPACRGRSHKAASPPPLRVRLAAQHSSVYVKSMETQHGNTHEPLGLAAFHVWSLHDVQCTSPHLVGTAPEDSGCYAATGQGQGQGQGIARADR